MNSLLIMIQEFTVQGNNIYHISLVSMSAIKEQQYPLPLIQKCLDSIKI